MQDEARSLRRHSFGIRHGIPLGEYRLGESEYFLWKAPVNGSGHAMAVVGYVAMHNTYSNAKKYLLVVWNGWTNQLQFLPYDVSIYTSHDGTYCKG